MCPWPHFLGAQVIEELDLGKKTRKIIKKINRLKTCSITIPDSFQTSPSLKSAELIAWLAMKQLVQDEHKYLLESLYVAILRDLYEAIPERKPKKPEKKADWVSHLKFVLLAIAGTIFFGCEGFDGIMSILSMTSLPTAAIFAIGLSFSFFSVFVFYACDLVEISKNLDVDLSSASKIVDIYLQEIEVIKDLRKALDAGFSKKSREELASDLVLLDMLQAKYAGLDEARQSLKKALDNPWLTFFRHFTAAIAGVLFFSGGFFAGQTVAMAIAGLFLATVTPTFWPVLLASLIVGIAALSMYWFVERPVFENAMGRWVGLDKENIEKLCDDEEVDKEQCKLAALKEKMQIRYAELTRIQELEDQFGGLKSGFEPDKPLEIPSCDVENANSFEEEAPFVSDIVNASAGETKSYMSRARSCNSFFKPAESRDRFAGGLDAGIIYSASI